MKVLIFASRFLALLSLSQCTILPPRMLQDLGRRTNISMERYNQMEDSIKNSKTHLARGSPSWYLGASHEMTPESQKLSRRALQNEAMSTMLVKALKLSPKEAATILPSVGVSLCNGDSTNILRMMNQCKNINDKYRTHSGRCNSALHPSWGAALEAYSRLLPPEYADGVSLPRTDLPSAREVSLKIHSGDQDLEHPYLMAIAALFGEFLAHDLSHTPKISLPDGTRLKCCDVEYEDFHPECFPIKADNSVHCMEYSRSASHPGSTLQGCKLGPRQQINQATSYVDLSPLYGNTEETAETLRSHKGGLLNTQRKNLLMPSKTGEDCRSDNAAFPCFLSGDSRVNEHPGLTLMHVLFLREHNRIAAQLEALNAHWDDETLYQEARRVLIAEVQHITYNEFLPAVLGEPALSKFDLRPATEDYFHGYDSRIDATLSNAAASAGLAFVAALIPKTIDLVDTSSTSKSGERALLSAFYAPQELYEAGAIDRLISGMIAGHSRKPLPPSLNEVLLKRYFHDGRTADVPIDFAAQVIQQGRDHGLPSYVKWRTFCGLPNANTFQDLDGSISQEVISKLQKVYRRVEDIDLVTGAFSEAPAEGSVVGPTFMCLLGRTFKNIRIGDRYWYENENTPGAFNLEQLREIRKSSMARILCDNGDRLKRVQPRAFILRDPFLNEMIDCSDYAGSGVDLTAWKEKLRTSQ